MLTVQLESFPPGTTTDEGPAGVGYSWSRTTSDRSPVGVGSSWNRTTACEVQLQPAAHRARLPRTVQLELAPEGTRLLWTNTLDTVPRGTIRLRVGVQLIPLGTGLPWPGFQTMERPPPGGKVLLLRSPVKLELALRAWPPPMVEQEQALRAWLPLTVRQLFPPGTGRRLTSLHEFTSSPQNQSAMDRPEGLPVGTDHSGEDQMLCSHADTATDGADTTGSGWAVNRTDGTSEARGTASTDQADMVQVVFMATHTAEGDTGSQYTQPTGLLQPPVQQPVTRNCCNGESSGRATETLPVQPMVSAHDRNMVVTPVSIQMMAGLHNPSNMAVPSAGMDVQDGSSDLAAQMGTSMQQQAQDVYWIHHSSLFHLIGKCFPDSNLCSSLQLRLLHRSQQAQDAVTMSPMWRMMSTDLQQQQHMVNPIYGPGMPRTPLHQNAGTPVGKLLMPGWDGYTWVSSTYSNSCHTAWGVYSSCFHSVSGRKDDWPNYDKCFATETAIITKLSGQWLSRLRFSTDRLHPGPSDDSSATNRHQWDYGYGTAWGWRAGAWRRVWCLPSDRPEFSGAVSL